MYLFNVFKNSVIWTMCNICSFNDGGYYYFDLWCVEGGLMCVFEFVWLWCVNDEVGWTCEWELAGCEYLIVAMSLQGETESQQGVCYDRGCELVGCDWELAGCDLWPLDSYVYGFYGFLMQFLLHFNVVLMCNYIC